MVRTFDKDLVIKYFVWALVFVYPTSASADKIFVKPCHAGYGAAGQCHPF